MKKIDINCGFGEGLDIYQLVGTTEFLKNVSSDNIACGLLESDPITIRQAVEQAIHHEEKIGAHPSNNDLVGFGGRDFDLVFQEIYDIVLY